MKNHIRTFLSMLLLLIAMDSFAQTPNYIYYVPFPEQQIHNAFTVLFSGTGTTYHTVISIVPSESDRLIYYDQWEDGYEPDLSKKVQSTTQIWGDGNPANGYPPLYPTDPPLVAGRPIILENDIALPRVATDLRFDGRDKFGSSKSLAVSRSSWALNPGPVLADAVEFYNTKTFGTFFYFPIGQNTPSDNSFSLVSLCIQASQSATEVLVDKDGNGSTDFTAVINEGESVQVNGAIMSGGTVTSSKPVQVGLITGKIGGTYASRWYSLSPYYMWDKSYFSPVGTPRTDARSDVFIFNPQTSALTVTVQTINGTSSFSIASKGVYRFNMPLNSSAHFHAALPFYALGGTDMDASNNTTWDWGYTLIPELFLTNSIFVGWGPGAAGSPIPSNGNPVWVSSTEDVDNLTVYIDLDGNPTTGALYDINGDRYDFSRVIVPYTYTTIYDTDQDQTGMHVYTLDGRNITAAWGEDATTAGPGNPFLDVGTTIPPDPTFVIDKKFKFVYDPSGNKLADAGDTILYILRINNYTLQPFTDIFVYDTIPSQVTYKPNSTFYDLIGLPDQTSPNTPFPLDQNGYYISLLPAGARDSIYFKCVVNGPITYSSILNRVTATDNYGSIYKSNVKVPANYNMTSCSLIFTDAGGTTVSSYFENSTIYAQVNDNDNNQNILARDSVKVTVSSSSGDTELVYLVETGINTGIFRRSLPSSKISGAGSNNGTLNTSAGNTIGVTYTDLIFGGACTVTNIPITGPSFRKPLYLSDTTATGTGTFLDRIKPYAADVTAANTATINQAGGLLPITVLDQSSGSFSVVSTGSIDHDGGGGSGSNTLLMVGISYDPEVTTTTVSSVTYNGTALTFKGTASTSEIRVDIWWLANPVSGSHPLVVTLSSCVDAFSVGAVTLSGVNTATPLGSLFTSTVTTGTSITRNTITSTAGEMIFSVVGHMAANESNTTTFTPGSSQTERWDVGGSGNCEGSGESFTGAGGTKTSTGTSETVSWTAGASGQMALAAVSIAQAANLGNPSISFTQKDGMCSDLVLPLGGAVKVKLWLTGHSGMGGTGTKSNITVVLKNNGTSFLTLSNPVFTDNDGALFTNDTLVFSGGITGAAQTILAGSKVSMDINSSMAGASFQISYDASAVPSMLRLPASNVIDVTSFSVYNAANPGGTVITSATNGATVYIRAIVADPFGSKDIHDAVLRITDPTLVNTDVTMPEVATNGCTKTFEYAWVTGVTQGTYSLRVISSEGYEGEVKDTAQTSVNLQFLDTGTPCSIDFTDVTYLNAVTSYANANGNLYFRVQDLDRNTNPLTPQSVNITVTSSSGDVETVTINESGSNTGVFNGSVPYVVSGIVTTGNGTVTALAGATLNFNYTDPITSTDVCTDNAYITAGVAALSASKARMLPVDLFAVVGDTVRWQITVTNSGNTNHTNISLTDTFNSINLNYISALPAPSSTGAGMLIWNTAALGGTLNAGQSVIITVTFTAESGGAITNTATASATGVNAVATSPVTIDNPHLSIAKSLTVPISGITYVDDNVTFRIVVTNIGNTIATTVPLVDVYSDFNLEYVSATIPPTAAGAGQIYWSNIGPIALSGSVTIDITFKALHGNEGLPVTNNTSVDFGVDADGNPIPSVNSFATVIVKNPPIAVDDVNSTVMDTPVNGTVMANDYHPDGTPITATPFSEATPHGSVILLANGTYTYTPAPGYIGTDSFTYQICDTNGKCATATVTITVSSCLAPPARPRKIHK
jgi:large repetitive protein